MNLVINIHDINCISGQQPDQTRRVQILTEQIFFLQPNQLSDIGVIPIEFFDIISSRI